MKLIFRPLRPGDWPGPHVKDRRYNHFTASWTETVNELYREAKYLAPRNWEIVLQVDAPESAMRLDGGIRADAKVNGPGIILSLDSATFGPLRWACDAYTHGPGRTLPGWQANVRAVVLTMKALRDVDRHGAVKDGAQYRGFSALPPAREAGPAMTKDAAARLLVEHGEWGGTPGDPDALIADPEIAKLYYRAAVKGSHPDTGGDPAMFRRLTEARDLLIGGGS